MVHHVIIAILEDTTAIKLETQSTSCNANCNWSLIGNSVHESIVVIHRQLNISVVVSNWRDFGCVTSSSPPLVWVTSFSGDTRSFGVVEGQGLSRTITATAAAAMIRIWCTTHNLLRAQGLHGIAGRNCKVALQRLSCAECPARTATTLIFWWSHNILLAPIHSVRQRFAGRLVHLSVAAKM